MVILIKNDNIDIVDQKSTMSVLYFGKIMQLMESQILYDSVKANSINHYMV